MLRRNFLKEKLKSGRVVVGTWAWIPSEVVADIVAASGLDFIVIDREHGPVSFETAQRMVMACESRGVSPLVRVSGPAASEILRSLEIGAHGLHVPGVSDAHELMEAVKHCKYPPAGDRGFSPFTRAYGYSHENSKKTHERANESTLLAVHVENLEAAQNLDEILKIKALDIVFIGLYDLSKSMGRPGEVESPVVQRVVSDLTRRILRAGKFPGTIVTNGRQLKRMMSLGIRYLTYSADCQMLLGSYRDALAGLKR